MTGPGRVPTECCSFVRNRCLVAFLFAVVHHVEIRGVILFQYQLHWLIRVPAYQGNLSANVHDADHSASVNAPDLQLVGLQSHCSDCIRLGGVPVEASNADSAPDLRVQISA